jgi:phosphatidylglycerophosphate synthase
MVEPQIGRRPLKTRSAHWAKATAAKLASANVTPNQISLASIAFAGVGAILLAERPDAVGLLGCAAMVQARLACNLLDGMVAVEFGKQSKLGALYNELPDRIADSGLIVALGYAIDWPLMGWLGALAAALTAYIRALGGSLGLAQDFRGPMAKPHRMATLTAACLAGAVESFLHPAHYALTLAALLIAFGSLVTCVTRTWAIADHLQRR